MADAFPILIGHAGRWFPYLIPIAIVLVAVVVSSVRERRQRQGRGPG